MASYKVLDDDIVRVYKTPDSKSEKNLIGTLFWGDRIRVIKKEGKNWQVELPRRVWKPDKKCYALENQLGYMSSKAKFRDAPVLKVRFVDVGQGDAAVIESPKGRIVLLDGGEEDNLRWYMGTAFAHRMKNQSLHCDAVIVTHGDADHFSGLTEIMDANICIGKWKPMITASRVFHNGLVKQSYKKQKEAFGKTKEYDGTLYAVDLYDDIRSVPDTKMNTPFRAYKAALKKVRGSGGTGKPTVKRIGYGDDNEFDFLHDEDINIEVLGPIVEDLNGTPALPFLRKGKGSSISASHTVNGHSVVLRMGYKNVRFLFGADLNEESQNRLLEQARLDSQSLSAEILKVPHHGSADFSPGMLAAIAPVVSVVSCGDENTAKEYIHPRAGLMGALGKFSRSGVDRPLVYATEMVAFFRSLGKADVHKYGSSKKASSKGEMILFTYEKKCFGIVHVRTDGERVLVATHSGRAKMKESYVFRVDESGNITSDEKPSLI
jgi:beta-lactamase superfamily II metal-dependent hydrolase